MLGRGEGAPGVAQLLLGPSPRHLGAAEILGEPLPPALRLVQLRAPRGQLSSELRDLSTNLFELFPGPLELVGGLVERLPTALEFRVRAAELLAQTLALSEVADEDVAEVVVALGRSQHREPYGKPPAAAIARNQRELANGGIVLFRTHQLGSRITR